MNKDYYSLRSDPFANRADPDVLVMTRPARRALAALLDAVAARRPVSALLGDPGMGKTTL
ncbi:MAG: AAA family ATPase, partial [Alphaproteobacteria bacterium]|nr:AAA family ATPase [Alphaproteobacteria bacterium]